MYITNLLFSKLVMLQVSKGLISFYTQSKNQSHLYNGLQTCTNFPCMSDLLACFLSLTLLMGG